MTIVAQEEVREMLHHALAIAKHGIKVFPVHYPIGDRCSCGKPDCKNKGKHPIEKGWYEKATSNLEEVTMLWKKYPTANIGVAMGSVNNLFCLDVDGVEGLETVKEWVAIFGNLPATWEVQTGGGGLHLWYRIPKGMTIPNSVKKMGIGVDLRGEKGLSVAPGSLHKSGKRYQWSHGKSPNNIQLGYAPSWLIEKIAKIAEEQEKIKREGIFLGELHLDAQEPPREKIAQVMKKSKTFQAIVKGEKTYESPSQRDLAISNILSIHNFSPDEIATTIYHFRKAHGDDLKHPLYYQLTVSTALSWAEQAKRDKSGTERVSDEAFKQLIKKDNESSISNNPLFAPKHFINVTDKSIHELAEQAWKAILDKDKNDPKFFRRDWQMVEIRIDSDGQSKFYEVGEARLRGHIDRVANWVHWKSVGKEMQEAPTQPPLYVVRDMLADPNMPLPLVEGITHAPVFSPEGELEIKPGYLPKSKLYYAASQFCEIIEIKAEPTREDVVDSLNLLMNELLIDFRFQNQASRAHALCMMIQPFLRQMIKGPTPLYLIDASKRGAGKSLLARVSHLIATGLDAAMIKLPKMEDEIEKQIVSLLSMGSPVFIWDNVTGNIDRDSLNSLLTSTRYQGRILGKSKMTALPNKALWVMTGNNVDMNGDIYRRVAWIRLQPQIDRNFQHSDLMGWTEEHRSELIHAILTLIQNWIAKGKPKGREILASFEGWSRVMGGLLEAAGVPGFLENFQELEEQADQEGLMWEQFCSAWWERYKDKEVLAKELWGLAKNKDLLLEVLGDGNDRSQKIRIGKGLQKQKDRSYGEFQICSRKDSHSKSMLYYLKK